MEQNNQNLTTSNMSKIISLYRKINVFTEIGSEC